MFGQTSIIHNQIYSPFFQPSIQAGTRIVGAAHQTVSAQ